MTRMASLFGPKRVTLFVATLSLVTLTGPAMSQAQETSITPTMGTGDLGTKVTEAGAVSNITGGTRPGGGTNLFHSFGEFSIATDHIANFLNETNMPTENILSRVTGGNPSNIFGTIQTTNFGAANLYLINPAGVMFGPTASLNVGGSFAASTADYLKMTDGKIFDATTPPPMLSIAPVAAFGFLNGNPAPISIQRSADGFLGGADLRVSTGTTMSFVGGDLTLAAEPILGQNGIPAVSAPSGVIQLASVKGRGEVPVNLTEFNTSPARPLGAITLSQGALVSASSDATGRGGGTVVIRGGQLTIDGSFIFSDTLGKLNGAPLAIDAELTGATIITASALTSDVFGEGNAGALNFKADSLTINKGAIVGSRGFKGSTGAAGNVFVDTRSLDLTDAGQIQVNTVGTSPAGTITIEADQLTLTGGSHIDSRTDGSGAGGRVTITANEVALSDPLTLISANSGANATGPAGDIFIDAATVNVKNGAGIASLTSGIGDAGNVTIKATDSVTIAGSAAVPGPSPSDPPQISTSTVASSSLLSLPPVIGGDAGQVTIEAPTVIVADGGNVTTTTFGSGRGGDVALDTNTLTITNGGRISGGTGGAGDGGSVSIRAKDSVSIVGQDSTGKSRVSVSSLLGDGDAGSLVINSKTLSLEGGSISALTAGQGKAGAIELAAETITVTSGSEILSTTLGTGEGGTITITGKDSSLADSLTISQSKINSSTLGNADAGQMTLAAKTILLDDGAILSASTGDPTGQFGVTGQGRAGDIVVTGGTFQVLNGATVDSSTFGAGQGGSVTITATEQMRLMGRDDSGRSQITAITTGSGQAGQIHVTTPVLDLQEGGSIFTNTGATGNAGSILVEAGQLSLATDALIASRSVNNATGDAGSVDLQATGLFSSQASTVSTEALQGAGGNVSIIAGNMNLASGTTISAQSAGSQDAGSIALTSATDLLVRNSTISTSAGQASGGNIKLTAPNLIRLVDSTLTSSVQGQAGSNGGNINIDPQLVVIQNSRVLANANEGAGGNITIVASGAVLVDPNSVLNATAGPAGVSGSVNINAPIQVLSGALVPLNLAYRQAGLSGDRCAADATGQFSSFVQAGRDGVPQVPGALSPSPLSFLDTLTSGSWGSQVPNWAAARLGLDFVSVDDSTRFRFHSACRS